LQLMADSDIERAAAFLATHALLLLGIGLAALLLALAAVAALVRLVLRYRTLLLVVFRLLITQASRLDSVRTLLSRSRSVLPGAYVALHLALGLLLVIAVTAFLVIAEAVLARSEVVRFDVAFAQAMHRESDPRWQSVFAVITAFGAGWILTPATALIGVALIRRNRRVEAFAWMAAQAGGGIVSWALKNIYERTRPEFADAFLYSSSFAFPSGHTMGTFIFFGLGSYLLLRDGRSWTTSAVVIALALSWCVIMGFSRLYLGVHFVSDVVAGLVAGSGWLAVCVSAVEIIRRRGAMAG
jgi:membrane-associated phospholipid phosphatase